ncbi:hypothetical protein TWF281_010455 [Arthrobotrys megalospora]
MASLVTLSSSPEILFDILTYLSHNDVFSVLQTCKSLFPVCHRHLWSVLIFQRDGYPWYPSHDLYASKTRYDRILELLQRPGADIPGLAFTKVLWLGDVIFGEQHFHRAKSLGRLIGGLLERDELDLRCAIVSFPAHRFKQDRTPDIFELLLDLKRYSERKSTGNFNSRRFSIKLQADTINSLPKYLCLELVTDFVLRVQYDNISNFLGFYGTVDDRIAGFISVLNQMPNLEIFTWKVLNDHLMIDRALSTSETALTNLQAAFGNLHCLRRLDLDGYMFHPHFFLIPPESVKTLIIRGTLRPEWWQKFVSCPLSNVRSLRFATPSIDWLPPRDANRLLVFAIEDVAVTELEEFWTNDMGFLPKGLKACIRRRNAKLRYGDLETL